MTEHELQNRIRVALSQHGITFRTNAGRFWQGKRVWSRELQETVIAQPQAVEGLPKGFTDLLFIDSQGCAFIEVKTPRGKLREEQEKFINLMRSYGHRAGVARSVEDALKIIGKEEK